MTLFRCVSASLRKLPGNKKQRGTALIETGLMLPGLLLMALGTMDLARVFFAGIVVEAAARSGVQYGSYSAGKAGAATAIKDAARVESADQGLSEITLSSRTFCGCIGSNAEVSCDVATCSGQAPDGYVETTATYVFKPLVPYPGIPATVPLSAVARMRVQ